MLRIRRTCGSRDEVECDNDDDDSGGGKKDSGRVKHEGDWIYVVMVFSDAGSAPRHVTMRELNWYGLISTEEERRRK